jgi:RNA polymerase sigma-70 factor, ECF subfamily
MQRDLVERAMSGDHDAFSELARVAVGRLLVIARLILHDETAAEDATQEALVAAWRHIRGLRDPERFEAWLHRLLVNACRREARLDRSRTRREVHLPGMDAPEPDETGHTLDRDQLERGFRRLDVDHRAVIVLYYYVGLRPEEAGEVLGLRPGTVRSRLHRAMQQMRAALEADARTESIREGRTA